MEGLHISLPAVLPCDEIEASEWIPYSDSSWDGTVDSSFMPSFGPSLDGGPLVGPPLVLRRLEPLGASLIVRA